MMRIAKFVSLVVFCYGFLCFTAAHAQTLWHGATYGMSVQEVRQAVPEASAPTGTPVTLKNGATELLTVPDLDIGGSHFNVVFLFLKGKLIIVNLNMKTPGPLVAAKVVFDSLVPALRSKYGKEVSHSVTHSPGGYSTFVESVWVSGRTDISMTLIGSNDPDDDAFLGISYQIKLAKERNNL